MMIEGLLFREGAKSKSTLYLSWMMYADIGVDKWKRIGWMVLLWMALGGV